MFLKNYFFIFCLYMGSIFIPILFEIFLFPIFFLNLFHPLSISGALLRFILSHSHPILFYSFPVFPFNYGDSFLPNHKQYTGDIHNRSNSPKQVVPYCNRKNIPFPHHRDADRETKEWNKPL